MTGYSKKISLIKGIKDGFSADGGELSGLIKVEVYAGFLKAEVSLINFAPLSEGKYVFGITDGKNIITFETEVFECESKFDLSYGFAALICYCNNGASPIASGICGDVGWSLLTLREYMISQEQVVEPEQTKYDDEAIAGENYYEFEADKDGGTLCENKKEEKERQTDGKNESDFGNNQGKLPQKEQLKNTQEEQINNADNQPTANNLAHGNYYQTVKKDIDNIFERFPADDSLNNIIYGTKWARITYGDNQFYLFGILSDGGEVKYICYALPSQKDNNPPQIFKGVATLVNSPNGGFWVLCQDAKTGANIKIDND
jgi:hypothetical protein